jgi:hypothetical protein
VKELFMRWLNREEAVLDWRPKSMGWLFKVEQEL